jgi:hypothetical protein
MPETVTINLGNVQPLNTNLTALAALATASNKMILVTGTSTFSLIDATVTGQSILAATNVAAIKTLLAYSTTDVTEGTRLYFTTTRVLSTLLAGLSISGGSIASSDTILEALGKLQNQINGVLGGAIYQSVWNATTNSPTLTSSSGTKGYYYIVNVSGSTNLNGITDWKVGDWAIFNGSTWDKVDNTDAVSSVDGMIGAVDLSATYQPKDTTLTALAGLTIAANSLTVGTGADAFSQVTFAANTFPARSSTGNIVAKTITDFALSLLDDTDASTMRSTLGLVIGTDVAPAVSQLKPTDLKNSGYSANPGDYIPVDTTSGIITITLPNAPADNTVIGIKRVVGATNNVTYNCSGADVLNVSGGSTSGSISVLNQQAILRYESTSKIWYVETSLSLGGLDARFLAIASPANRKIYAYQNLTQSHTGDTANTILYSALIPANTMGLNDKLMIDCLVSTNSGAASTRTFRLYVNDTNDLTTPILVGTRTLTGGNITSGFQRRLSNKNSLSSQEIISASTDLVTDVTQSTSVLTSLGINFAIDQYVIFAGQNANSGDTISLNNAQVYIEKP